MTMASEVCRLCLIRVDPSTAVVLNEAASLIESILQLTNIEVVVDPTRCVFICDACNNTLGIAVQFRAMCLQNDDAFRKMLAEQADETMEKSDKWENEFVRCKVEIEAGDSDTFVNQESEINIHDDEVLQNDQKSPINDVKVEKSHKRRNTKRKIHNRQKKRNEEKDKDKEESVAQKNNKKMLQNKTKSKPSTDDPVVKVQCQNCGEFFTRDVLRKHLLIHRVDRPMYACDQCPKKYPYKKNLKAHVSIVHEGQVVHSCDQCGKAFSRKDALGQHYTAEHTDLKKYECKVCGQKFGRSSNLHYHHRMNHTSVRPYVCEYCTMTFKRSNDLILHVRTHTGEKPFKCELCDKRFAKSYNVVIHKKSHKNAEMRHAAQPKLNSTEQSLNFSDADNL